MRRLIIYIFACYLILLQSVLASNNSSNNTISFALNDSSNNINIPSLVNGSNNSSNNTNLNNLDYGIFILLLKSIPIAVFVTVLLYLISLLREKKKLEQFYIVKTYVKKLKPEDFDIQNYHTCYIRNCTYDIVLDLIKKGEKRILIKGVSGSGKTRTTYEVIKEFGVNRSFLVNKINNIKIPSNLKKLVLKVLLHRKLKTTFEKLSNKWEDYFIILPSPEIKLPIYIPKNFFIFKRKIILIFDDIDKYIKHNISIESIIKEFEKNSDFLIVLATCRLEEFEVLEKEKIHEIFNSLEYDTLSKEDGENLARGIGKTFNPQEFDGTAGSIVLESPRKKRYWKEFVESEKNILRCIKLLNHSNLFYINIDLLNKVHEKIFNPDNDKFNTYFHDLQEKKFIYVEKNIVYCPDYYLSKVVDDYPIGNQLFLHMLKLEEILAEMNCFKDLFYLSIGFYFKEDYQNALNCYDKALEINPKYDQAWLWKGFTLTKLDKINDAINCYDKALEINPKYDEAWYRKALTLTASGKYDDSITYYDRALEINPKHVMTWFIKGVTLAKSGKYDDAINCIEIATRTEPDNGWIKYVLAVAYSYKEDKEKVISNLKKAIEIDASYKEKAKADETFEYLWNDKDFKNLVG